MSQSLSIRSKPPQPYGAKDDSPEALNLAEAYTYDKLPDTSNSVRLLRVAKSQNRGDCLKCTLTSFTLSEVPPFCALSYAWGPAEEVSAEEVPAAPVDSSSDAETYRIWIDDGFLEVLDNLYHGLLELRARSSQSEHAEGPRKESLEYLWIDAICINQKLVEERNQQVNIMDEIYSRADTVVVWLGQDTRNEMPQVLNMFEKFKSMDQHVKSTAVAKYVDWHDIYDSRQDEYLRMFNLPPIEDPQWSLLLKFFGRRWFSRLWILQEIALANNIKVFCGTFTLKISDIEICSSVLATGLERAIFSQSPKRQGANIHIQKTVFFPFTIEIRNWCSSGILPEGYKPYYQLFTGKDKYDFQTAPSLVLAIVARFSATDARDKVFALIGVLKRMMSSNKFIKADYTCSKSKTYTEATRTMLKSANWLGFLCFIRTWAPTRDPKLPSWVPDFEELSMRPLSFQRLGEPLRFNSSGKHLSVEDNPAADVKFLDSTLLVTGHRLATLNARSEILHEFFDCFCDFEDGLGLILALDETYRFTNQSRIEALWRTIMIDKMNNITADEYARSFSSWLLLAHLARAAIAYAGGGVTRRDYIVTIPNLLTIALMDSSGIIPDYQVVLDTLEGRMKGAKDLYLKKQVFLDAASPWITNRRLFSTLEGHLGIGHAALQAGDEIWICPRSYTPFILRPVNTTDSSRRYTFVGECYVHGMMQGEAFHDSEPVWEEIGLV